MKNEETPPDAIEVPDAPPVPGLTFRSYRGEEDLPHFIWVYDECRQVDGFSWILTLEEMENNFRHLVNTDTDQDVVVVEMDGQVIGYIQQNWVEEIEAVAFRHQQHLVPEWRGRGIREAMLRRSEARARQLAGEVPQGKPQQMRTWLCEDEAPWIRHLEARGHAPARYFYEMLRDLRSPIVDRPLPEGLDVRPVPHGERRRVMEACNEALKDHWAGREWTEEDFQDWLNDPILDPSLWVVAYHGDRVAGTVLNWVHQEENERLGRKWGYTEMITVQRPYRGRGLAKALVTRSMLMLRDMGMEFANLGVDTENPSGALGLYEGLGYENIKTYMIYGKDLGEVP
jgi:ribosomal protein S18 acetylase RimI-like enzyme